MSDIAKGITDCLDTINKLRDENTAQAARIAELEDALRKAKAHFLDNNPIKAFVEVCTALAFIDQSNSTALTGGKDD